MNGPDSSTPARDGTAPEAATRRGDLDALRGFAMVLGLVLHASLAYVPYPWPVQDQSRARLLGLVFSAIHGFRMPLFFLLSGFFTMLVFRRRGLRPLVVQRTLRILVPLAIAAFTILPLDRAVFSWAIHRSTAATAARLPLVAGILSRDARTVRRLLEAGEDPAAREPVSGLTPLELASLGGDTAVVAAVLDAGAAIDGRGDQGGTPLHAAAFMGRDEVVDLLLARGADPRATNGSGRPPLAALAIPPGIAVLCVEFLGLTPPSAAEVERGRRRIRDVLGPLTSTGGPRQPPDSWAVRYHAMLASPRLSVGFAGRSWQVFETDAFDHLWFLWYLVWLTAGFAGAVCLGLAPTGRYRWWLVPASCLPFALMWSPFGPDTALGLVPAPHLFLFYGCFYWFGAATYAADGADTPLGSRWPILLPLCLLAIFPLGIATMSDRPLAAVLQPAFAWGMSLGLIGAFRRFFSRRTLAVRWLADASYWMYLVHLPLVIVGQVLLRDVPWPAAAKFLAVLAAVAATTLLSYRWCVRYTPIGWLLNGRRSRHDASTHA